MNEHTRIDETQATQLTSKEQAVRGSRARTIRLSLFLLILIALAAWAWSWARQALVQVHETDARITADLVAVSSRVAGWMVRREVDAGTRVVLGQPIAIIDAREAETRLTELEAELERIEAQRAQLASQIIMVDNRTHSRELSAKARLQAARAFVQSLQHASDYAERELQRAQTLLKSDVVAPRAVDEARTVFLKTQQELARARAGIATAQAEVETARADRHEVAVLESERATLAFQKAEVRARIERQGLDVSDHTILSPLDGVVSKAFADVGEYVQPGQRIALVHDPRAIYVEANIRETEIRRVQIGQTVRIEVDAYPDEQFEGTVKQIGHAATSAFSLLPSPNPSGNFTKVTQRLPVRVSLEQRDDLLRPGMMVEIYIDVGG